MLIDLRFFQKVIIIIIIPNERGEYVILDRVLS